VRLSKGKPWLFARPWQESKRVVLLALIGANVAAFIIQLVLEAIAPGVVHDYLALSKDGLRGAYSWQFITSLLVFGGPLHFLGNTLALYILGRDIESILGQRHFLYLFLSGTFGGEIGHLFLMPADTLLYAASGGVAAVTIAYATILPELDLIAWDLHLFRLNIKAKHLACALTFLSLVMLMVDRHGAVIHSAIPGGLATGWVYAHLLGFGHPSWLQQTLARRRTMAARIERLTPAEFIQQHIDPVLEKISRSGIQSLTRSERRVLARARDKFSRQG
jgi:membrane associated rhomboid family serine protease